MARRSLEEIIASDPRFANVDIAKAKAYYKEAKAQRSVENVELPEVTVTAIKKKPKSSRLPTKENAILEEIGNQAVVYQKEQARQLANTSSQNLKVRRSLAEADARTNAQTFTGANVLEHIVQPIANLYMPSQWVGAIFDAAQHKKDKDGNEIGFWNSLGRGNSGFVSDKFAEEHPYLAIGTNLLGDAGIYSARSIINGAKRVYNSNTNLGSYLRNPNIGDYSLGVPLYKDKYYRVVTGRSAIDDANKSGIIRAKTGIYKGTPERIWNKYKDLFKQNGINSKDEMIERWIDDFHNDNPKFIQDLINSTKPDNLSLKENFLWNVNNTIRASTNHGGTVGFSKGKTFYPIDVDDRVIVGTNKSATFAKGHHGGVNKNLTNENISQNEAVVLLENGTSKYATAPAGGFKYYEPTSHSLAGRTIYRRRKFNNK